MASPNQLSFLPDDYMEKKLRRRTNAILGTLFLIVVSSIGGTFVWKERSLQALQKQKAQLDQEMTEAARPIEQFKQMQDKQRQLAQQAELTASLLERVPRTYLLAEITNGIPAGVSLLDFDLSSRIRSAPAPVATTAFQQRAAEVNSAAAAAINQTSQARSYDVTMKLTGVATTDVQVAQFITKLNSSDLLTDVNLVVSDEFKIGNDTMRKFQIEMMLNPAAQVSITDIKKNTNTAAAPLEN
jgi:Tfp pilus assembly protein PilN